MKTVDSDEAAVLKARQTIGELLEPLSWESFCAEHWDKKPLHTSLTAGAFADYATPAEVRRIIESGSPWQFRRMPEMYLDGYFVSHDDLVDVYVDMDGREARSPRLKRIRAVLEAGATVNSFGQTLDFPKLAALRQNFALAFGAEVEVATFYSQRNHQGLAPHYDCVEIFVLQIAGTKQWHVSGQRAGTPLVGYGTGTVQDPSVPNAKIDLEPGDLLYLPRGTFHHAVAISDESLHATVAVKVPSYLDLLTTLVKTAPNLDTMRGYLPLSAAFQDVKAGLVDHLKVALDDVQFETEFKNLMMVRSRG